MSELYSVRTLGAYYIVTKFDEYFNPLRSYKVFVIPYRSTSVNKAKCECFKKDNPSCRHRVLVNMFKMYKKINKGWFFDWNDRSWEPPLTWPVSRSVERLRIKL